MSKYETLLKVLPQLIEKVWPGKYTFSNFYHVKTSTFQIDCSPDGHNSDFVFLTADGKTLDEAVDKLFGRFHVKMNTRWDEMEKLTKQVNLKMKQTEETITLIVADLDKHGFGPPKLSEEAEQ